MYERNSLFNVCMCVYIALFCRRRRYSTKRHVRTYVVSRSSLRFRNRRRRIRPVINYVRYVADTSCAHFFVVDVLAHQQCVVPSDTFILNIYV